MAKPLDGDEAEAVFERFKKTVTEIAAVPKAALEKRRKRPRKKKPSS